MLFSLLSQFSDVWSFLDVFKYITFRTGGAILTAFLLTFLIAPPIIKWLKSKQTNGQPIRELGEISHKKEKSGTPTMGGLIMIITIAAATLLWAKMDNPFVWILLGATLLFGAIGFLDDCEKLIKNNPSGISAKLKFSLQIIVAGICAFLIASYTKPDLSYALTFPFFKSWVIDLGIFYIPFAVIVIVGASNAVNLTDGLDGLATGPVMICSAVFLLITYLVGNAVFANYLQLHYVAGVGELAVFCGALVGACLGFLWFNAPPAKIFMGDTGSLALGGALGAVAVATKHEIVLAVAGGVFVIEALSVILQVASFRITGKRIFKMAPIHHHFEKKGWAETTVVVRFWILAIVCGLLALATLKLR